MRKWPLWLLLASCLSFAGCMKNETGDSSLLRQGEAPKRVCEGLIGEKTEVLFSLLQDKFKKKTSIKNLWLHLKLPKGINIRSCQLKRLSPELTIEKRDAKGKLLKYPKAKGTYQVWDEDKQTFTIDFHFIKEKGRWWLLPTYDTY